MDNQRKQVDAIYSKARRTYRALGVEMDHLVMTHWITLKWALDVTLGTLGDSFTTKFDPVLVTSGGRRYFAEVSFKLPNEERVLTIFQNNEVAFNPDVDVEIATLITKAFEKWCELVEERTFRGAKI